MEYSIINSKLNIEWSKTSDRNPLKDKGEKSHFKSQMKDEKLEKQFKLIEFI